MFEEVLRTYLCAKPKAVKANKYKKQAVLTNFSDKPQNINTKNVIKRTKSVTLQERWNIKGTIKTLKIQSDLFCVHTWS